MQFTTVALTFVAAVAAINPNAKEAFVANYIANAKRQASASRVSASASASASASVRATTTGSGAGVAAVGTAKASALPTASTSDATVMALSGSALLAGVMALVL
ncbi:protein of unknown function [Taphrina deformans PYCC 5710]|uniref:Uncharacterized protein n=1 Tax=Taphrina deformans (strain PYCC 5710 / ATCC 11124 / CBS 356.35 / IMI 108563 / JCM 9778 / NBRC 8474) TaxID=1097556 RepID=R4XNL8_TAPDE|nr:protein of unknown function [Taphrina deformans PYCC 5710]|eukprot:CCG84840.1 protein of unknown function [Taphrina deformans PYCC 5710]